MKRKYASGNTPATQSGRKRKLPRKSGTTASAATIRSIAKKVILGTAETKVYTFDDIQNVADAKSVYHNLTYGIDQGSAEYQRIGRKIHITNIRVKGNFYSNTSSISNSKIFRVTLIKTTQQLGTTKGALATQGDVFLAGSLDLSTNSMVDLKKTGRIFHDQTFYSQPVIYNTALGVVTQSTDLVPFEFNCKIDRTENYKDDSADFLQTGDYYLILSAYDGNITLAPGGFNYAVAVNFKDE